MMTFDNCILCLEDDEDACELMRISFALAGYQTDFSASAEEGIKKARTKRFAAIVMDHGLKDSDGITACKIIRGFDYVTPIVFYSGETRDQIRLLAIANGANAYLIKPDDFPMLVKTVLKLVNQLNTK